MESAREKEKREEGDGPLSDPAPDDGEEVGRSDDHDRTERLCVVGSSERRGPLHVRSECPEPRERDSRNVNDYEPFVSTARFMNVACNSLVVVAEMGTSGV